MDFAPNKLAAVERWHVSGGSLEVRLCLSKSSSEVEFTVIWIMLLCTPIKKLICKQYCKHRLTLKQEPTFLRQSLPE